MTRYQDFSINHLVPSTTPTQYTGRKTLAPFLPWRGPSPILLWTYICQSTSQRSSQLDKPRYQVGEAQIRSITVVNHLKCIWSTQCRHTHIHTLSSYPAVTAILSIKNCIFLHWRQSELSHPVSPPTYYPRTWPPYSSLHMAEGADKLAQITPKHPSTSDLGNNNP